MKCKLNKKQWISLVASAAVLSATLAISSLFSVEIRRTDYELRLHACEKMESCMTQIRQYKLQRGLELSPEDTHKTGLLGDSYSFITTTLGSPEAKRTTANAHMAALMVELLQEAGVKQGDVVGAGFSGSFPAMNLALLCACDAMDVTCVYIASVGSSTYGANQNTLTFPDMACLLVQDGLLSTEPVEITPGGAYDVGSDMDQDELSAIWKRLSNYNIPLYVNSDYASNIAHRIDIYEKANIKCFIGVGGNVTTLGKGSSDSLPHGYIPPNGLTSLTKNSGLVRYMSAKGLPVIMILNIKSLVADYGIPFDPEQLPAPGTGPLFYKVKPSPLPICIGLLFSMAILVWGFIRQKEQ